LQAALVQIKEGLYFRSPRLATRFESNAANIALSTSKSIVKLNYKIQYPRNSGNKNSQDHISSVFSVKIHRQNIKNALR